MPENIKKIRTRFAPSPTGKLHIGGIRTALYNYLFAKQNNGEIILRLEDTDQKRYVENSVQNIKDSFEWLDIKFDKSPWKDGDLYKQSKREYLSYALNLVNMGLAYYAFDTSEELDKARTKWDTYEDKPGYCYLTRHEMKNSLTMGMSDAQNLIDSGIPYVIRFLMPDNKNIKFDDLVKGKIEYDSSILQDTILFKSDGYPTYHLANVVDDHKMEITHVIRGDEWVSSTPLHICLYEAFGWDVPKFAHLPLLLTPDGKKISKRNAHKYGLSVFAINDDENTKGYKELGYEPKALLNYLALLGWSPGNNIEILTINDMIEKFDITKVQKSGAKLDKTKLDYFNSVYVRNFDDWDFLNKEIWNLENNLKLCDIKKFNNQQIKEIMRVSKERSIFKQDLIENIKLYVGDIEYVKNADKKVNIDSLSVLSKLIESDIDWTDKDAIKQKIYDLSESVGIKMGKVMPALRFALLGGKSGPDLLTTAYIFGKEECIRRIEKIL